MASDNEGVQGSPLVTSVYILVGEQALRLSYGITNIFYSPLFARGVFSLTPYFPFSPTTRCTTIQLLAQKSDQRGLPSSALSVGWVSPTKRSRCDNQASSVPEGRRPGVARGGCLPLKCQVKSRQITPGSSSGPPSQRSVAEEPSNFVFRYLLVRSWVNRKTIINGRIKLTTETILVIVCKRFPKVHTVRPSKFPDSSTEVPITGPPPTAFFRLPTPF